MIHSKPAPAAKPILEVIQNRWSPYGYSNRPVDPELVMTLLEAARWAPSSFNEQPWNYVVGYKGDSVHAKLADCLNEGNAWAREVPVLMLSIAKTFFDRNHKPNRHALHDLGCASGYMFLQATALDLYMHQMAGFSVEKARDLFEISDDFEPAAMIAIGHPGEGDDLTTPRVRRKAEEMIWKVSTKA